MEILQVPAALGCFDHMWGGSYSNVSFISAIMYYRAAVSDVCRTEGLKIYFWGVVAPHTVLNTMYYLRLLGGVTGHFKASN